MRRGVACAVAAVLAVAWNAVPAGAGTGWAIQPVPKPASAHATTLTGVSCSSGQACTAVGSFAQKSGTGTVAEPLAERWDGASWVIQPVPGASSQGSGLSAVSCPSTTSCTAFGSITQGGPLAEHWDGASWTIQLAPGPAGAGFYGGSCWSASACIAVGSTPKRTGGGKTLAERWNGVRWAIQPTPSPVGASISILLAASCSSAAACTAVGWAEVSKRFLPVAERWNGTAWTLQAVPGPAGAVLNGVSCPSAASCTAVGNVPSTGVPVAEHWDGTSWTLQSTPNPGGASGTILSGVSCQSDVSCTAVGPGIPSAVAEHWDGTSWMVQPTPLPQGAVYSELDGVSCPAATTCIATGHFNYVATASAGQPLAERN